MKQLASKPEMVMGREEVAGRSENHGSEHSFLDGESGMLLLAPVSKKIPAMIDPPARVVPTPLPRRNSKSNALGAFPAFELLCA